MQSFCRTCETNVLSGALSLVSFCTSNLMVLKPHTYPHTYTTHTLTHFIFSTFSSILFSLYHTLYHFVFSTFSSTLFSLSIALFSFCLSLFLFSSCSHSLCFVQLCVSLLSMRAMSLHPVLLVRSTTVSLVAALLLLVPTIPLRLFNTITILCNHKN